MSSCVPGNEWHARTLRAWQLAILRFAVTLDDADRLTILAIAHQIDGLAPKRDGQPDFNFFRKTSAEVCSAILRPGELTTTLLRQYLVRIDDDRLRRAFAAAVEVSQPKVSSVSKPIKRDDELWRGLVLRGNYLR
jgi:hypothetical protein